ncbi:hypothetical protein Pelo_2535 [Pelomyxa schiedti]|nr:hypothetical protein Pelo_2535 [Pelomyxa schiedti]
MKWMWGRAFVLSAFVFIMGGTTMVTDTWMMAHLRDATLNCMGTLDTLRYECLKANLAHSCFTVEETCLSCLFSSAEFHTCAPICVPQFLTGECKPSSSALKDPSTPSSTQTQQQQQQQQQLPHCSCSHMVVSSQISSMGPDKFLQCQAEAPLLPQFEPTEQMCESLAPILTAPSSPLHSPGSCCVLIVESALHLALCWVCTKLCTMRNSSGRRGFLFTTASLVIPMILLHWLFGSGGPTSCSARYHSHCLLTQTELAQKMLEEYPTPNHCDNGPTTSHTAAAVTPLLTSNFTDCWGRIYADKKSPLGFGPTCAELSPIQRCSVVYNSMRHVDGSNSPGFEAVASTSGLDCDSWFSFKLQFLVEKFWRGGKNLYELYLPKQ